MKSVYIKTVVHLALAEDIGRGDITTNHLISSHARARARLIAKSEGTLCGVEIAREVFKALHSKVNFHALIKDGQTVRRDDVIAEISGSARALLSGERVAINLLSFLSGIATQTRRFVDQVKPYKVDIMDTRKTTPLLRQMERYAVRCGGGVNHRFNLHYMGMIKDNHLISCRERSMVEVIETFKKMVKTTLEVEVDNLDQFKEILRSRADIILLDNMPPQQIAQAVKLRNKSKSPILLEASGGITLKNIKRYAATGVERISIGALTHSRQVLDISLEFIAIP
ncbi:MAG: carboxylating nicotinate-nucleotide diphosphorylase [Candidatus Omnitrophica bacterium]|nr:carboxylating nicotinate-nucleotide diphosphorylase [Candidatus Omnitrophota bacterium]